MITITIEPREHDYLVSITDGADTLTYIHKTEAKLNDFSQYLVSIAKNQLDGLTYEAPNV